MLTKEQKNARNTHKRKKRTEYKRRYRARMKNVAKEMNNSNKQKEKETNSDEYDSEIFAETRHPLQHDLSWWSALHSLNERSLAPLNFSWDRICPHCSVVLLTGESSKFCCNDGKRIVPALPPYPTEISNIFDNPNISILSRKLNTLFSFTSIGVQGKFIQIPAPSSVCITGRTYHRVLPANTPNHSIHWYLYDEQERYLSAQGLGISNEWISSVQNMLSRVNPYVHSLRMLKDNPSNTAFIELQENTSTGEVAAIMHANNIVNIQPRSIIIWRNSDIAPKFVNILSSQYEPLQYPLLFPHGTPGWHANNCYNFSQIDWYRCRLLHEERFSVLGRLTSEFSRYVFSG